MTGTNTMASGGGLYTYIPEQADRESVNLISRSQARGRLRRQACDRGHPSKQLRANKIKIEKHSLVTALCGDCSRLTHCADAEMVMRRP